jgi:dihydrofolate reductase
VAIAENDVIGSNNKLLWHLPADLKYFRQLTTNNIIVMGRKTYESIGKPLPNRTNIVISRNAEYALEGCFTVTSVEKAIEKAAELFVQNETTNSQKIFIIGGAQIYKLSMPLADKLYVTEVKAHFEGDTFFDPILKSDWKEISRIAHNADEKNNYKYDFVVYQRK